MTRQGGLIPAGTRVAALAGPAALCAIAIAGCNGQNDAAAPGTAVIRNTSPAGPGSLAPHLASTPAGEPVLSWLEPVGVDGHAVRYSVLRDEAWSAPVSVAEGGEWFVNYADFPSVVPITTDRWAAHWLPRQRGGTYAYDIALSLSADAGATWAEPFTPHDDGTPTEHGFVSLFPWAGAVGAVWLDGRYTSPDVTSSASPDTSSDEPTEAEQAGGMTLRYARFDYAGQQIEGGELDERVCDCCQTDVAMGPDGPIVAYRDRSGDEIRDISVIRHAGGAWNAPLTISDDRWQIPACPVNGPAIAAAGAKVVVAWYAAPDGNSRVKIAWSRDAGRSFGAPVTVDSGAVSGRVDVVLLDADTAAISWVGKTDAGVAQLRLRTVGMDGTAGPVRVVAEGDFSRGTGFPQMVGSGSGLVLAWPEGGENRRLHTGWMPPDR